MIFLLIVFFFARNLIYRTSVDSAESTQSHFENSWVFCDFCFRADFLLKTPRRDTKKAPLSLEMESEPCGSAWCWKSEPLQQQQQQPDHSAAQYECIHPEHPGVYTKLHVERSHIRNNNLYRQTRCVPLSTFTTVSCLSHCFVSWRLNKISILIKPSCVLIKKSVSSHFPPPCVFSGFLWPHWSKLKVQFVGFVTFDKTKFNRSSTKRIYMFLHSCLNMHKCVQTPSDQHV